MKTNQRIFLIAIIVIAILAISGYILYSQKRNKSIENNITLTKKYVVLADKSWTHKIIPSTVPQQWNAPERNVIVTQGSENEFSCNGAKARVINYPPYTVYNAFGGWDSVSIVDCGLYYFVYEHKYAGSELYGPFGLGTMPATDPVTDWKTYRDDNYGFEFKYPSNWVNLDNSMQFGTPDYLSVHFRVIVDKSTGLETLQDWLANTDKMTATAYEGTPSVKVLSSKNVLVGGNGAVERAEFWNAAGFSTTITYIKVGSYVYELSILPNESNAISDSDKNIYYEILSTFKFTK